MSDYGDLIRQLRTERPSVLLGSAASYFDPTCLPTGGAVSSQLLDSLFPDQEGGKQLWPYWLREDAESLPFEAVIGSHPKADHPSTEQVIANLFGSSRANRIHEAMVAGLGAGSLFAVVTTNYDMALDSGLPSKSILVTDDECVEWLDRGDDRPRPVVKLHGSANQPETLIYALKGEHGERPLLPESAKLAVLRAVLAHRPLIVAGYSGRDLDVCPAIAQIAEVRQVIWVDPNPTSQLTANAARVLGEHGGLHVRCDLRHFFSELLEDQRVVDVRFCGDASPDLAHFTDEPDMRQWRLAVLDRMGCASPRIPTEYRTGALDAESEREFLLARFGHTGRYRDAARSLRKDRRRSGEGTARWIQEGISESTAWLLLGSTRRARRGLDQAAQALRTMQSPDPALEAALTRLKLTDTMRRHQWASRLKRRRRAATLRNAAVTLYENAKRFYERDGDWDVLQILEHEAQRLGIDEGSPYALPVTVGYESLGLRTMAAISSRDRLRRRPPGEPWRLSSERQQLAEDLVEEAERYGRNHEAWKLYWILSVRGTGVGRLTWFLRWLEHFLQVQYQVLYRFVQPLAQIARSGAKRDMAYPKPSTLDCGRSDCPREP